MGDVKKVAVAGVGTRNSETVEDVARANPDFTYTIIRNGVFHDWGLETGFLFEREAGKPTMYDSGNQLFSSA
jgi:hypothetical protein